MSSTFLRPLSIGEILDGAFAIYRLKFTTFFTAVLVLYVPALICAVLASALGEQGGGAPFYLGFVILQGLATLPAGIASVWIASETVLGRSVDVGDAAKKALLKFFPVLLVSMLVGILVGLGTCLLIVPGILIWIMLFAFLPILVIEDRWDFFGRSQHLARGAWLKIFVVTIIYTIIAAMPAVILQVGGVFWAQAAQQSQQDALVIMPIWITVGGVLVSALTGPYSSAALTLLYYDQRVRKDGLDVELAAAAVDSLPSAR